MNFIESQTVELKEKVVDDIKKEVIAFANSDGGTLYVGITDDGNIAGVDDPDANMLQISNMIRDAIKPDITMFVEYYIEEIKDKKIIRVYVQKGTHSPYYLVGKGIRPEGVYIRQGTSAVPASEETIRRMIKDTDGEHFECIRSLTQSLSFSALEAEFKSRKIMFGENQLVTLGIKTTEGIYTNLGLLLSDQCVHTIKAAVFEGEKKAVFQDRRDFSGSLLQQMNEAYNFIDLNNKTKATFLGLHRIDQQDYPEEAVREALLNSLVHREYSFSGSTLISIFSDRLEFVSFGGLVKGLTINDILLGISQCRNEKLAAIFYRLKLIEAYGTGIPKIMESYEGSPYKPQIESSDNAFKIILPNRNFAVGNLIDVTDQEKIILELAKEKKKLLRRDIEERLNISSSRAGVILKQLVEHNLLDAVANGRNRFYIVKK